MRGPRTWRIAALVCVVLIVIGAVTPTHGVLAATVGPLEDLVATTAHFVEYAVLAFVLAVALDGWRVSARALVWSGVLSVGLGWAMELVQAPLPYRDFQVSDGLTDVSGAAVGLALFSAVAGAWGRRRPERRG